MRPRLLDPCAGAKGLPRRQYRLHGRPVHVRRRQGPDVPKPIWRRGLCKVETEENENRRHDQSGIQGCRGNVVILQPPTVHTPLDVPVEHGADKAPTTTKAVLMIVLLKEGGGGKGRMEREREGGEEGLQDKAQEELTGRYTPSPAAGSPSPQTTAVCGHTSTCSWGTSSPSARPARA